MAKVIKATSPSGDCPECGGPWGVCPHGDVQGNYGEFLVVAPTTFKVVGEENHSSTVFTSGLPSRKAAEEWAEKKLGPLTPWPWGDGEEVYGSPAYGTWGTVEEE